VTIEERQHALLSMREQHHRTCPVCGDQNPTNGLHTAFEVRPDGVVEAEVTYGEDKEGYDGHLHGGILAGLLDGAMTNCLFAHGHTALTGELKVRYKRLIATNLPVTVRGWIERSSSRLHVLRAEARQEGQVKATATGKFMDSPMLTYQGRTAHAEVNTHHDAC